MHNVMLDTNLLIDFVLIQWKRDNNQEIHKGLKRSEIIFDALLDKKFVNHVTEWNFLELRDVVEKLVLGKKLIENGYSLQEFSEGKSILPLTSKELDGVNDTVEDLLKLSKFQTQPLSENNLKKIKSFCLMGSSLLDTIHLYNANSLCCSYFITRDKSLIQKFNENKGWLSKYFCETLKIISRKKFISKLNN